MTAAVKLVALSGERTLASDGYREVDVDSIGGSREGPFERLEPDVGKLASPVL